MSARGIVVARGLLAAAVALALAGCAREAEPPAAPAPPAADVAEAPGPGPAPSPPPPSPPPEELGNAEAVASVFPDAPAPVAAALVARLDACDEAGGEPFFDEDAVRRADLDGDGRDDWVIFDGWITCEGGIPRPGLLPVAIHRAGGRRPGTVAWEGVAYDVLVEEFEGRPAVWLEQTGAESCGEAAEHEAPSCWRAVPWNARRSRFAPAGVETVRPIGE